MYRPLLPERTHHLFGAITQILGCLGELEEGLQTGGVEVGRSSPQHPQLELVIHVVKLPGEIVDLALADPSGILLPVVKEEVAWGDAGLGLGIFGTGLAVVGIMATGTPEQASEWLPLCFEGESSRLNLAAFGVTEPDAGSDVSSLRSRAIYDDASVV